VLKYRLSDNVPGGCGQVSQVDQNGGAWQHTLGSNAQIGLSAENTASFIMNFDYIRVYRLAD
jgi:hypothetical protein